MDEIVNRSANIHAASAYLLRFDEPAPAPPPAMASFFESREPVDPFNDPPALADFMPDMTMPDMTMWDMAPSDMATHDLSLESGAAPVDAELSRSGFEEALAAALQEQQAAHDERLRLLRSEWVEQEAEALGSRMAESMESALELIRAEVARILAPFVAREIEEKARDELVELARRAFAEDETPAIHVEGPKDLIEKVAEALATRQVAVALIEANGVDVKIDLAHTRLETRLDAWMRSLSDSRSSRT